METNDYIPEEGKVFCICGCLGNSLEASKLQVEIAKRIHGYAYFGSWLFYNQLMQVGWYVVQHARRAWMLDMIEEFKGGHSPQ